jgi:hypothetical protein
MDGVVVITLVGVGHRAPRPIKGEMDGVVEVITDLPDLELPPTVLPMAVE